MTVNYDRKMVYVEVDTISIEGVTIGGILEVVQHASKEHGNNAWVSLESYPYSDDTYYAIMVEKLETDKQYNERIALEEKYSKQQEVRDAAEFKRLSEKFGNNG